MTRCLAAAVLLAGGVAVAAPVPKQAKASDTHVVVVTSLGDFEIELFPDKAPKSVKNFLAYTDDKFYDGLTFHRVIPDFMVQGGGFEPGLQAKKVGEPIPCEADNGLKNVRGTVAVARALKPDSGTSQFFINTKDNPTLDRTGDADFKAGFAVFGKVVEGMEVVDAMAAVKTGPAGVHQNVPVEDVVIKSVRRKR
jgi:cyclophilin family peptidyl-prolyl cis-trans isomerase